MILGVAYSNTKPQVTALADRFLNPQNQTSRDSDPCDHDACGRHQTRLPRAVKDRLSRGALDAITAEFTDGSRQVDLAAEYGISLSTVKRILKNLGANRRT